MIVSLDTETTGVDFHHGARPFFVTVCGDDGEQAWWEWEVNPETREPKVPLGDLRELWEYVDSADVLVLQNAKFDVMALSRLWGRFGRYWPWGKTHDTLRMAHLLASNQPKDLTSLAAFWLGVDIQPYEDVLDKAVKAARAEVKRRKLGWAVEQKDRPDMPSAKEKTWKYDTWLMKALDPDSTVLRDYSNVDSSVTVRLYGVMMDEIERRGYGKIYEECRGWAELPFAMESRGITLSGERLEKQVAEYRAESDELGARCVELAAGVGCELQLPKSGVNNSLRRAAFDGFRLPRVYSKKSKTDNPTLDRDAVDRYLRELPEGSPALEFVQCLSSKRRRDTAVTYMESYRRYWLPVPGRPEWHRLYPSLNMTGTDTLRWSSSNPNEQNISKKEDFNVRYCFGPAPGREWWALDAKNIELRIPGYGSGEQDLIDLFEKADEPPYYGSEHLLNFSVVYPDVWEDVIVRVGEEAAGAYVKKEYKDTWYKWCKNGGFAVGYQAGDETADKAFKREGSRARLKERFAKKERLNRHWVEFADRNGYVETMPDRSVDPDRGYPLLCTRSEHGRVKSTVPLNFHVQGTAMWWMARAMSRCHAQCESWAASGLDAYVTAQIHDELVFDFPYRPNRGNLPKVRVLRRLMEQGGTDIGVPTPVSIEYHERDYADGVVVT